MGQAARVVAKYIPTIVSAGVAWLLNDSFNDTLAAGSVNGTAATPGPGTRVVVDTESKLSLNGGNAVFASGKAAPAYNDPLIGLSDALTRTAGLLAVWHFSSLPSAAARNMFGFSSVATTNTNDIAGIFPLNTNIGIYDDAGVQNITAVAYTTGEHRFAIVLRSSGAYYFMKGSALSNWTLLWHSATDNTATVYINTGNYNLSDNQLSAMRVPEATWLPTPLAYDTFTDSNGTSLDAHSSDSTGPDSQGCTSRSWTELTGNWDIQSNRAQAPTTGPGGAGARAFLETNEADIVLDCIFNVSGQQARPLVRLTDVDNYWFLKCDTVADAITLTEYESGGGTARATVGVTIDASTDYDARIICDGNTIDCFLDGGNKITYGSATFNNTATKHGIGASNHNITAVFDNFTVFARDDGFSELDKYIG
jgi:hypothetical protein